MKKLTYTEGEKRRLFSTTKTLHSRPRRRLFSHQRAILHFGALECFILLLNVNDLGVKKSEGSFLN